MSNREQATGDTAQQTDEQIWDALLETDESKAFLEKECRKAVSLLERLSPEPAKQMYSASRTEKSRQE